MNHSWVPIQYLHSYKKIIFSRNPPAIPARKLSRAGVHGEMPPQRPPKPLNGTRRTSEDTRSSASGGSSPTLGGGPVDLTDSQNQNTAWYEYGCV